MPVNKGLISYATKTAQMDAFSAYMRESANESGQSQGEVEDGVRWVTVVNLQSDAGKKLNGKLGKVLTQEPNKDGRHQVQVEGIKQTKLIKPTNIEDIPVEDLMRVYRIPSNGEGESHQVLIFPKRHSLFQNNPREGNALAMALCGLPLMIQKAKPRRTLKEREQYDNQWATWLMILPKSGFALPEWQSYVGPVYVFRPNGSGDVSGDDMDATNEFLSSLLDEYGEGPDFDPRTWLNPEFFRSFLRDLRSSREESNMGSTLAGLTLLEEGGLDEALATAFAESVW